jgi:hypothetical protein
VKKAGEFGIIIAAKHGAMAVLSSMAAKECRAPTHHQYKTILNMYEKAKNPSAAQGAPMSLMSNLAPKVAIMVASRCCVYILHTCMYRIMYSNHSTRHFSLEAAATNVLRAHHKCVEVLLVMNTKRSIAFLV